MSDDFETIRAAMASRIAAEEHAVRELGDRIGYGRIMQLAEKLWREKLIAQNLPGGGEITTGPCAAFMVQCPCPESGRDDAGHCEWCCGAGRVTKLVAETIATLDELAGAGR